MKVYIQRHGMTEGNNRKAYLGCGIDEPLCPEGRQQLNSLAPSFPKADLVYVSPLKRARETASLCYPNATQVVVHDLREMDFGEFEGKNYYDLSDDCAYRAWVESGCTTRCPGGETQEEFRRRTVTAVQQIIEHAAFDEQRQVVIVAHNGTVMSCMSYFAPQPNKGYFDWSVANGEFLSFQL